MKGGEVEHGINNSKTSQQVKKYQSPSLLMFAEGNFAFSAAGTFPENDGRTITKRPFLIYQ